VKEFPLPNAESRPRRIAITSDDVIWYSDHSRGFVVVRNIPTKDGDLVIAESGVNVIGLVDIK